MKAWKILPAACLLSACLEAQGLSYDELHLTATLEDGTPLSTTPQDGCIELPLLLGSQVEDSISVENAIDVEFFATRDSVRIDFRGAVPAKTRTILAEELASGFVEDIVLDTTAGQRILVRLTNDCPEAMAKAP